MQSGVEGERDAQMRVGPPKKTFGCKTNTVRAPSAPSAPSWRRQNSGSPASQGMHPDLSPPLHIIASTCLFSTTARGALVVNNAPDAASTSPLPSRTKVRVQIGDCASQSSSPSLFPSLPFPSRHQAAPSDQHCHPTTTHDQSAHSPQRGHSAPRAGLPPDL